MKIDIRFECLFLALNQLFLVRLIEINDNDKLASADQESFAKNLWLYLYVALQFFADL